MKTRFPTPRVVVSGCLDFEACRYNGQRIPFDLIRELEPYVKYVPICPEVEIGLGIPREPIRLVTGKNAPRLVQPATELDVTAEMNTFSTSFLAKSGDVDGFILKSRSPSCGLHGVKVYDGPETTSNNGRAPGLFAAEVMVQYPGAAMEDEGRLRNYRIREHFLTKLFGLAQLRCVSSMRELVAFHTEYKLVLMTYNQKKMRDLGRLVGNAGRERLDQILPAYRMGFGLALRTAPRYTTVINTVEHAYGHMSDKLKAGEKNFFQQQLKRYKDGRLPVSALTSLVHAWAVRFEVGYLLEQSFFQPYPAELASLSDSGKGRLRRGV